MKLNYKRTFLVGLAFLSISMFWQMYDFAIPLILRNKFGLGPAATNAIMGIDNLLGLFMLPLFGALSDKVRTKIGRRMPFILLGTAIAAVFMIVLPIAANMNNLVLFSIALGLVLIAMATYRSPAVALMPDITAKPVRSQGNAVINLMGTLGGALFLIIQIFMNPGETGNYIPIFTTVAVFMVVCVLILFVTVNENKYREEMEAINYGDVLEDEPSKDIIEGKPEKLPKDVLKSMIFLLSSIFLWVFGYNAVTTTFSQFMVIHHGMEEGAAASAMLVAILTSTNTFMPISLLTAVVGRRRTILGALILGIGLFTTAIFVQDFTSIFTYLLFGGIGIVAGTITVNTLPMVLEMSQGATIGRYTGYYYTTTMSSQIFTPAIVGLIIQIFNNNYDLLFPYAVVCLVLSFIAMLFVKHGDVKPVAKKNIEAFDVED